MLGTSKMLVGRAVRQYKRLYFSADYLMLLADRLLMVNLPTEWQKACPAPNQLRLLIEVCLTTHSVWLLKAALPKKWWHWVESRIPGIAVDELKSDLLGCHGRMHCRKLHSWKLHSHGSMPNDPFVVPANEWTSCRRQHHLPLIALPIISHLRWRASRTIPFRIVLVWLACWLNHWMPF